MPRKQKKYHYIYKTTCDVSEKYYIGMHSTDKLDDDYMGSGKRLWASMKYYGKENFTKEILEYCDNREILKKREREIVNEGLLSEELCMNLIIGGEGGYTHKVGSESAKNFQQSGNDSFIKRLQSDELLQGEYKQHGRDSYIKSIESGNCKLHKDAFKGKKHSDETKRLMSEKKKGTGMGKNNSVYGRKWMNKDGVSKMVKKEEIEEHSTDGWLFGKKIK